MRVSKEELPAKSPTSNTLNGFKIGSVSLWFPITGSRLQLSEAIRNKLLFIFREYSADKTLKLPFVSKSSGFFYNVHKTLKCRFKFDFDLSQLRR